MSGYVCVGLTNLPMKSQIPFSWIMWPQMPDSRISRWQSSMCNKNLNVHSVCRYRAPYQSIYLPTNTVLRYINAFHIQELKLATSNMGVPLHHFCIGWCGNHTGFVSSAGWSVAREAWSQTLLLRATLLRLASLHQSSSKTQTKRAPPSGITY